MSPADNISLYFPSIKIFRLFCQKEEDLLPLFRKMLEGVYIYSGINGCKFYHNFCINIL